MSREVDAMVAEKVMGWTSIRPVEEAERDFDERALGIPPTSSGLLHRVPHYSTDPAAAMEVVERMGVLGYNTHIEWKGAGREFEHTAEVSMHKVGGGTRGGHATADTFTLAASLAALRAVSANGKEPGHE